MCYKYNFSITIRDPLSCGQTRNSSAERFDKRTSLHQSIGEIEKITLRKEILAFLPDAGPDYRRGTARRSQLGFYK